MIYEQRLGCMKDCSAMHICWTISPLLYREEIIEAIITWMIMLIARVWEPLRDLHRDEVQVLTD